MRVAPALLEARWRWTDVTALLSTGVMAAGGLVWGLAMGRLAREHSPLGTDPWAWLAIASGLLGAGTALAIVGGWWPIRHGAGRAAALVVAVGIVSVIPGPAAVGIAAIVLGAPFLGWAIAAAGRRLAGAVLGSGALAFLLTRPVELGAYDPNAVVALEQLEILLAVWVGGAWMLLAVTIARDTAREAIREHAPQQH